MDLQTSLTHQLARKLNEAAGYLVEGDVTFHQYIERVRPQYIFYNHCELLIARLQDIADGKLKRLMVFMPPRSGKKLADSTPIFTPSGWRTHGELRPGDFVYHPSGQPVMVLATSEKTLVDHEVEFSDGSVIKCHRNHEWTVFDRVRWSTVDTAALGLARKGRRSYRLPHIIAPDTQTKKEGVEIWDVGIAVNPEPGQCIQVSSPDGLYLAGENLLATHNSELVSRLFPGYFLHRHPEQFVGLAGYGAELVNGLSRNARDNYTRYGNQLSGNAQAVQQWETTQGGGLWAAGIGGSVTGRGFNCIAAQGVIRTASGSFTIRELYEMDKCPLILSFNHEEASLEYRRVIAKAVQRKGSIVEVRFDSGRSIRCTSEHLFYVTGHGYKQAGSLIQGQAVIHVSDVQNGDTEWSTDTVSKVVRICEGSEPVYDLQVEGNSNFFANGILVHNCGIIDDCLKDAEAAQSETILEKQWDWWLSTWYTRQEPDASMIHLQTRWSQEDLAGRILVLEDESGEPEHWYIINFEAIKSERPTVFPVTCIVESDSRQPGEALCEERQPLAELERIKKRIGSYWFAALYQQSPTAEEGNMWKREWFETYNQLPEDKEGVITCHSGGFDWDTAYTKDEKNAANAYVYSYVDDEGSVYIHDFDFRWCETPDLVAWMKSLGGPHYIEKKASGKSAKHFLDRDGIYAIEVDVEGGDKIARTRSVLPVGEAHKIFIRTAILDRLLDDDKQGILAFPNSKWKDVNDAFVQAINRHVGPAITGLSGTWTF